MPKSTTTLRIYEKAATSTKEIAVLKLPAGDYLLETTFNYISDPYLKNNVFTKAFSIAPVPVPKVPKTDQ